MKKNTILVSLLAASFFTAQGIQNYQNFGGNFFPQSPNATPFALAGKVSGGHVQGCSQHRHIFI